MTAESDYKIEMTRRQLVNPEGSDRTRSAWGRKGVVSFCLMVIVSLTTSAQNKINVRF